MRTKVFVLGLPHSQTTLDFMTCAFTQKALGLCRMLESLGDYEVLHIANHGSKPPCTLIPIGDAKQWKTIYGDPGAGHHKVDATPARATYIAAFAAEMRQVVLDKCKGLPDYSAIICCPWPTPEILEAFKDVRQLFVESGIGYPWSTSRFRIYNSYAWMHWHEGKSGSAAGKHWYHVVIPSAFDPKIHGPVVKKKDNYLVYMGRLGEDKGVRLALRIAKELGAPIRVYGQGDPSSFKDEWKRATFHAPIGVHARNKLLQHARACLIPSYYIEPDAMITLNAALSGCPTITTDWGGFPELTIHGVTGYRCRTLDQFIWAARNVGKIDPHACRAWAVANYSYERVAPMYREYFQMLLDLSTSKGWDTIRPGRAELDWLRRDYSGLVQP